jgi:dsRNA-specific ribonuclease
MPPVVGGDFLLGEKIGSGNSKQKARQDAASKMLKSMKIRMKTD